MTSLSCDVTLLQRSPDVGLVTHTQHEEFYTTPYDHKRRVIRERERETHRYHSPETGNRFLQHASMNSDEYSLSKTFSKFTMNIKRSSEFVSWHVIILDVLCNMDNTRLKCYGLVAVKINHYVATAMLRGLIYVLR